MDSPQTIMKVLFGYQMPDGKAMPPNPYGIHHESEHRALLDSWVEAGLIEFRGVDTCGTAWYRCVYFDERYNAIHNHPEYVGA